MAVTSPIRVDRERFAREGYLVIEDVFDPAADLDPVVHEYAAQLDEIAADWHARGLIDSAYADLPFSERFGHVLNDAGPEGYRPFDIPVEMKRGTALFMHRLTMHWSLRNLSNAVRWSFDLHYQPVGQPTGRNWLPAFVARSRADPRQEIRDWRRWADLWWQARAYVAADPGAQKPRRWTGPEAACA